MALLRKEFTRAQHRSYTRRVCECQLCLRRIPAKEVANMDHPMEMKYICDITNFSHGNIFRCHLNICQVYVKYMSDIF